MDLFIKKKMRAGKGFLLMAVGVYMILYLSSLAEAVLFGVLTFEPSIQ